MAGHFSLEPVSTDPIRTQYRSIQTAIPVPESLPLLKALDTYESHSMHGQLPIVWDRAEGFQVHDAWGNTWIDFTSTIFVTNSGHGNPRILKALQAVLDKPLLHTYTYASQERVDYLKYLIENTPNQFEKAFCLSSGTEATEVALKLMRLHGRLTSPKKIGIICIEGNWHGRTLGAQMMGFNPSQKEWIGYLDPHIYHIPFPYPWSDDAMKDPAVFARKGLEKLLSEKQIDADTDLCGFLLETFQGWGAVFYPPEFVQEIERFCRQHGLLLSFDEMQAGFGRTGTLFGYMHYGVEPDLLCLGKGASSSLPLSIVLGRQKVMDLPDIGSMSSTHSANPMVCAAGKANLEALLEDGIIENSKELGKVFHEALQGLQKKFPHHLRYVMGKGLLAALHFKSDAGEPLSSLCDRISLLCLYRGLIVVHTGRESIKLAPPLVITRDALLEGVSVLESAISDALSGK